MDSYAKHAKISFEMKESAITDLTIFDHRFEALIRCLRYLLLALRLGSLDLFPQQICDGFAFLEVHNKLMIFVIEWKASHTLA